MFELEFHELTATLAKLSAAFVLALPVGWEREKRTRLMGLRTFPIVALATCAYILVVQEIAWESDDAQARVIQGLVTGMGFIGGGAILKEGGSVKGTATASSLWATGAVGVAVAYGRFEIAIAVVSLLFLALRWLTPIEQAMNGNTDTTADVEE